MRHQGWNRPRKRLFGLHAITISVRAMGAAPAAIPARSTVSMGLGVTETNTSGRKLPPTMSWAARWRPARGPATRDRVQRGGPPEGAFHDRPIEPA